MSFIDRLWKRSTNATSNSFSRWVTPWLRPQRAEKTGLPLNLSLKELEAIKTLRSTPSWPLYLAVLAKVAESQAQVLASGLDHDKYLFSCGALTALRRIYTLADDLVASAANLKEISDDRSRNDARVAQRHASSFVNTPWFDGWKRDSA